MCKAQLHALVRSKPGEDVMAWTANSHCSSPKCKFGQLPYFEPCTAGTQASSPVFAYAAIAPDNPIADAAPSGTLVAPLVQTPLPLCLAPIPLSPKQLCLVVIAPGIQPVLCFLSHSSPQPGQQALAPRGLEATDHTQTQSRENPRYLGCSGTVPTLCAQFQRDVAK